MAKYQIESIQSWPDFQHGGVTYSLSHLDAHEIVYKGEKQNFTFAVTYGLHCFAKEATPYAIPVVYKDGREEKTICMERYEASKQIRHILVNLPNMRLFNTAAEKYFTLEMMNSATGQLEPYKICIAFYKEKRLLRMHILSAFFVQRGPGAPGVPIPNRAVSFFKVATDTKGKEKRHAKIPSEANNLIK